MTGEPRDPHSVSAFMTTGMWGVRVSRWGGPPGRAELAPTVHGYLLETAEDNLSKVTAWNLL